MAANPPLTAEQEFAFSAWYSRESAQIYWPDANNMEEVSRDAFAAGVRAAENADSLRYEAQYARRFSAPGALGGARAVERNLRENRGRQGTI